MYMDYLMDDKDDFVIINPLVYNFEEDINYFPITNLIHSICYCYHSKKDIYNQFCMDMKRTKIYYKKRKISYKKLYKLILKDYKKYKLENILLCLTQSIFYWPYKVLQYRNKDVYLGELSNSKSYVIYNNNSLKIHKQLRTFEVDNHSDDKTLDVFDINYNIHFDKLSSLQIVSNSNTLRETRNTTIS